MGMRQNYASGSAIKFLGLNLSGFLNLCFSHLSLIFPVYKVGIIMSDSLYCLKY